MRLAWLAVNTIGDSGAAALAAALPQMASLTTLHLSGTAARAALGLRLWGWGHCSLMVVVGAVCLGVRAQGWLTAASRGNHFASILVTCHCPLRQSNWFRRLRCAHRFSCGVHPASFVAYDVRNPLVSYLNRRRSAASRSLCSA